MKSAVSRMVKVGVLHQQLAQGILRRQEAAIVLHEDGLALGGVVGLDVLQVAGKLPARAAEEVQPADLRRAGGDPDHAGTELPAEPCENIVIHVHLFPADQGHGTNLAHQINAHVRLPPTTSSGLCKESQNISITQAGGLCAPALGR